MAVYPYARQPMTKPFGVELSGQVARKLDISGTRAKLGTQTAHRLRRLSDEAASLLGRGKC